MSSKRVEHTAGILRDLGLAAVIGAIGDRMVNSGIGRANLDAWGVVCGFSLLVASVYAIGVETRRRGA